MADEDPEDCRIYSGNIDLLLVEEGKRVWIVDFKGQMAPRDLAEMEARAPFRENALQVEAYRRALTRMGYTVVKCGLLYLGRMVWVGWG